jgi:hypothetical protein
MTKNEIANRAESGLAIYPPYVARRNVKRGVVTLRHSWPDDIDARVWDGVKRAAMALCQTTADKRGKSVDLYTHDGVLLEVVEPRR